MYWKDHTFIICAYGESPYLKECIRSLLSQTVRSHICIATSTPTPHIQKLAQEYQLALHVNTQKRGIASDWNFAYTVGETAYRTLAHQDDVYFPKYTQSVYQAAKATKKPLIFFTDYCELRGKTYIKGNPLLRTKRLLLLPLRNSRLWGNVWIRRRVLSFGSPICCPSVTFAAENIPGCPFSNGLRVCLDWAAWEKLSRVQGEFTYVPRFLMAHRIHGESETSHAIRDHVRCREDEAMFCKFWPPWIAKLLLRVYAASERSNGN